MTTAAPSSLPRPRVIRRTLTWDNNNREIETHGWGWWVGFPVRWRHHFWHPVDTWQAGLDLVEEWYAEGQESP